MSSLNVDVVVDADCGNAPRKAHVRDWLIALAEADIDLVCAAVADDVRWDVAGDRIHDGIHAVRRYVRHLTDHPVTRLHLRHLLSHGKQVCAEGETTSHRFVHVITYTGHGKTAKIAEVVSYLATTPKAP